MHWPKISLSLKCRILFGFAVLLILTTTLYLPWQYMRGLAQSSDKRLAEQIALAARMTANLDYQEWPRAQEQFRRDWPETRRAARLPDVMPGLISVEDEARLRLLGPSGFLLESMIKFQSDPTLTYTYKFQDENDGSQLRLAMAIRTVETDPHPNQLRGIVHLRMPIQTDSRFWSSIVLVLAGLCGGFLAMLVFYLVTQRLILRPVRELRDVTELVTGGDIDVQAHIATGDEFEDLANAFNQMLHRINRSHDELRKINRSLDIKLEELAETNVALYESNKLKSAFIANVSHELRTPLGLIINFSELLRDAIEDPPQDKSRLVRYTTNILRSSRSLLDIINDLLDLAKIEAGRVELHISDFSITETCEALLDFVRPLADKKNVQIENHATDSLPVMNSDPGKVKQILYNLLSNAIKFTPDGGTVSLNTGREADAQVWFSVSDTGPGIAKDKFKVIFEKFRQIDSSLTREHGGTGLGLAITSELVQLLGGLIHLESEVGQGSTFTVTLPLQAPHEPQQRLIPLND